MKLPPYPKYKTSGVEWFDLLPDHWEIYRLGHLTTKVGSGKTPRGGAEVYLSEGVLLIRSQNIHDTGLRLEDAVYIDESVDEEMAGTRLEPGDVLLNITGASLGRCSIAPNDLARANVNQHVCIIRLPQSRAVPRFIQRAISSSIVQEQIFSFENGSSREGLNFQQVRSLMIALPSSHEQLAIADFLDRETGKIETLVAKKRTLIERLKEKRIALISRAVTRGLPPDTARAAGLDSHPIMKPSGVEWLGDVPEHWELKRLKNIGSIRYGLGEPPEYAEDGIPFIRATDINRGKIDLAAVKRVSPFDVPWSRNPLLKKGEILVVRSGAYTGDSAIVTDQIAGCIAGYDMVVTPVLAFPEFLAWTLLSKYMLESQIQLSRLRAAQPHLNAEDLGGFLFIAPLLQEQKIIAEFLDCETNKIDKMVAKVETAIKRLQEYRSALITAAVTGKIDIRGVVA